jgi:hypothetical protein
MASKKQIVMRHRAAMTDYSKWLRDHHQPGQPLDKDDLVIGAWDCDKSPIGKCVYDDPADRNHDFCLFCGDPEERK